MRRATLVAAIMAAYAAFAAAPASSNALATERDYVLRELQRDRVAQRRLSCATGRQQDIVAQQRAAGFSTLSASAYCVTVLTRAGRDGTLRFVTLRNGQATPAIAFDTGFVTGYLKRETLPADAPAMATLMPIAERCLAQTETDHDLCSAAGHMLGVRAARGELVPTS